MPNRKPVMRPIKGSENSKAYVAIRHMSDKDNVDAQDFRRAKENALAFFEGEEVPSANNTKNPDGSWRGVVDPDATVADTAYVSPNARVLGCSKILDDAHIGEDAIVIDGVVQDQAQVRGKGFVGPGSFLKDKSQVIENGVILNASLHDEAMVAGAAMVNGKEKNCEIHDEVYLNGTSQVIGENILRGKMQIRGSYVMKDAGDLNTDKLFVA